MKDKKRIIRVANIAKLFAIVLLVVLIAVLICDVHARREVENYETMLIYVQAFSGLIAILVAAETAKWILIEPKFVFEVYDQHDSPFELIDNKYIPLAITPESKVGYLPYSPSDWEIDIINVGKTAARNVKIEISAGGIFFEDKSNIYDVKDFMYGYGVFSKIVFDSGEILKPNERIRLPKIPFQYAECDCTENSKSKMRIVIYNDEIEATSFDIDICFVKEETVLSSGIDEVMYDSFLEEEIKEFVVKQGGDYSIETYHRLSPYECIIDPRKKDIYRKIYETYFDSGFFEYSRNPLTRKCVRRKMKNALKNKALFWGRIYYRSCGLSIVDTESILMNDI